MSQFTKLRNYPAAFKKLFEKHLLLTNTVSTGALLGIGDFIVQRSNITYQRVHHNEILSYDKWRTGEFACNDYYSL